MPSNNDLKPFSTTDIPILSPTIDKYYDCSSIVQAMVDFHDATHLFTTNPAAPARTAPGQATRIFTVTHGRQLTSPRFSGKNTGRSLVPSSRPESTDGPFP
jgi:hypothetical protein